MASSFAISRSRGSRGPATGAYSQTRQTPFTGSVFTALILGIVETAMVAARVQLTQRADSLRPYERVEWINAEQDASLVEQAYEGMLRAVKTGANPLRTVLLGKTAAAGLAEDCPR